jgi:hypothetical protein|tara:strand:- start:60 stop:410 length:351 start_codon:yes stop_codon:yes gene_type:complete
MKYLIANDVDTLGDIDASDEIVMFPRNAVLCIESLTDTTTEMLVQSSSDVDADVSLVLVHADKSAAATHKVERNLIDDIVSAVNSDGRRGYHVLFDALNNVKLPNQTLASSTVTED